MEVWLRPPYTLLPSDLSRCPPPLHPHFVPSVRPSPSARSPQDVVLVGSMGPPGGGREAPPARLLRHWATLCLPEVRGGAGAGKGCTCVYVCACHDPVCVCCV
jgi:hypothetical protein